MKTIVLYGLDEVFSFVETHEELVALRV
jgi:hypothetical protein